MFDPNERNPNQEKPKITRPKPTIPSKPKYIPPVNLKVTPKTDSHLRPSTNGKDAFLEHKIRDNIYVKNIDFGDKCPPETTENAKFIQHQSFKNPSHDLQIGGSEARLRIKNGHEIATNVKVSEIEKKFEKFSTVAPNSPSTVCCSILSNSSAADCCGIMGQKKEMTSKSMTKIDSLDSNSSDSGGFKDFIQIESVKRLPDFEAKFERKFEGHQRKFSQPDFLEKSVSERAKSLTQSFSERKSTSESDDTRKPKTEIGRLPKQNLVQTLAPSFTDKTEDISKNFQKPPVINQGQFKQSKKHLEELLAQRLESEKQRQKKINLTAGGDSSKHDFEQQMAVQKQFQQKLQADLNKTVKQIQEIQSTELRLPQNRSWDVCSFSIY